MEPPYVGCYNGESGVALVITLILLSVITFMAITFLVVSRGEKSTVGAMTEQTTARLAAETALEVAQSQFINYMLAFTNPYSIGMFVSTNYINPAGFIRANGAFLTNVSYAYPNGTPINNDNDSRQNIANLFYLPRVPVFTTNPITKQVEFVYYIDINRNGRFETNGLQPVISPTGGFYNTNGQPIGAIIPGNTLSNNLVGEPEWIGMLERGNFIPGLYCNTNNKAFYFPPGFPHSADNMFISRYAYLVIPTSSTLDLNYIHNYAKEMQVAMPSDAFWRNQNIGSWEINLAALLADLNTNVWDPITAPYNYVKNTGNHNTGFAFDDAATLLRYRYGRSWQNLATAVQNFGVNGARTFLADYIDGYTYGLMTGSRWNPVVDSDGPTKINFSWSGSDNPSNFFDPQELFDTSKTGVGVTPPAPTFTDHLKQAGNGTSTYDRTTFNRLLATIGVDSAPESPKMNLNYANVDNSGTIVPNLATNFVPWQPVQFFTNAAARMLVDAGFGTNVVLNNGGVPRIHIQIYPRNYYTPSVQRYLQLAANIYDATTTNGFPSVFRPIFSDPQGPGISNAVWITGYFEITNYVTQGRFIGINTNINGISASTVIFHDLENDLQSARPVQAFEMVHGVPVIVGAKKGLPNFNEFAMQSDISAARKLTFHRLSVSSPPITTNQIFNFGITNMLAVEAWNSYSNTYPATHQLQMVGVVDVIHAVIGVSENGVTNYVRAPNGVPLTNVFSSSVNVTLNGWVGTGPNFAQAQLRSFLIPIATNYLSLTNSTYLSDTTPTRFVYSGKDRNNEFPVPRLYIKLEPRIRYALIETNRIIDYVNMTAPQQLIDVASLLQQVNPGQDPPNQCDQPLTANAAENQVIPAMFCTNRWGSYQNPGLNSLITIPTYGVVHQIAVSAGPRMGQDVSDSVWRSFASVNNLPSQKVSEQNTFYQRMTGDPQGGTQLDFDAPFTPHRTIHQRVPLQANDPLVHYTVADMTDPFAARQNITFDSDTDTAPLPNIGGYTVVGGRNMGTPKPINEHCRPWGGNPWKTTDTSPPTGKNIAVKDPLITRSDDWDFMTNKFPNVGWLGRVHRGTAWQTMFLKSTNTELQTWTNWSGNSQFFVNYDDRGGSNYDCVFSMPTNDYRIFDLFTTAFNENASKGQLSVNQTSLPAWSAVLSGVLVNTNGTTNGYTWIEPAGNYDPLNPPALVRIVNGINKARANPTNYPYGQFTHRGDILSAPELSIGSPYLTNVNQVLPDWAYERIPQQIMGLLRSGDEPPRFVIYAFGQALKPAEHSLVTASGQFFGMPTNYQVTAESVIRAVVRVDNVPTPRAPNNIPRVYVESFNVLPPY